MDYCIRLRGRAERVGTNAVRQPVAGAGAGSALKAPPSRCALSVRATAASAAGALRGDPGFVFGQQLGEQPEERFNACVASIG
jgi:hypothetical protein